ncbi:unnamed protein product [Orchesella dallaii]|uniref:Uncharacterized protein n=1 Tax=Orchesella dallaii TaxID=48710 RepID=A0ABP1RMM0_9HEXA
MRYMQCCVIYWDRSQKKFMLAPPYIFYIWCTCYYEGIVAVPLLFLLMHLNIKDFQEADESENEHSITRIYKSLAISFNALITCAIIFSSLMVSILKQMRVDICFFYNATFQLDTNLKESFKAGNEEGQQLLRAAMNSKAGKFYEMALGITTIYTIGLPIVMFFFMFHPTDPLHRILVDILDIPVEPTSLRVLAVAFGIGEKGHKRNALPFIMANDNRFAVPPLKRSVAMKDL